MYYVTFRRSHEDGRNVYPQKTDNIQKDLEKVIQWQMLFSLKKSGKPGAACYNMCTGPLQVFSSENNFDVVANDAKFSEVWISKKKK